LDLFEKCTKYTAAKEVMAAGFYPYFRVVESEQNPEVMVQGKKMIMLGSNNYLGLTSHPKVKEAAIEAVKKYGSGCAGSRFLNGTLDIHVKLEEKLAKFFRKENALTFSPDIKRTSASSRPSPERTMWSSSTSWTTPASLTPAGCPTPMSRSLSIAT
jgi:hypothetical protein